MKFSYYYKDNSKKFKFNTRLKEELLVQFSAIDEKF